MAIAGVDTSATGLIAYSGQIAVISNNVANINTAAFKRSEPRFQDILYQQVITPGAPSNLSSTGVGVSYGRGVAVATIPTIFQQGPLEQGTDLDVAINGLGFFRVRDSEGNIFFTRLGAFQPKGVGGTGPINIQVSNQTLTLDPPVVLPGNNAITTVDSLGVVRQGSFTAQINLTQVQNPDGLEQVGDLLFRETVASGATLTTTPGQPGFGTLVENRLEGSNVDLSNELIGLLQASQNFSLNSQAFVTGNEEVRQVIALVQQV
ncbi:flagellar hook-basal body complex protein [bacterium]|jgi:flagellar basal-body rod protein FlgG|nr:flagellar hook-basal body complex protein [bacterium]